VDGAVTGSREDIRVVATGDRALSWNRPYPAGTGSRFHRVHDVDSTAAGDGEAENVETLVDAFRELFDATEVS
jgi:hypothetical protein